MNESRFIVIIPSNTEKKDLIKLLDNRTKEYFDEKVNGSITLHYSQGYFAKLESTRFD